MNDSYATLLYTLDSVEINKINKYLYNFNYLILLRVNKLTLNWEVRNLIDQRFWSVLMYTKKMKWLLSQLFEIIKVERDWGIINFASMSIFTANNTFM